MKRGLIGILTSLVLIPLVSAANWGDWGSPQYYLDNEWVKFAIVFTLLFLAIYTFLKNKTDNVATSAIAGGGISLLLIIPIMRRGILDAFLGDSVVDWILIIAIIIIIFFIGYKFGTKMDDYGHRKFSIKRFFWVLVILIIGITYLAEYLPEQLQQGIFMDYLEITETWIGIAVVVLLAFFLISWIVRIRKRKRGNRRIRNQGGSNQPANATQQQSAQKQGLTNQRRAQAYIHSAHYLQRKISYWKGQITINHNKRRPQQAAKAQQEVHKYTKQLNDLKRKARRKLGINI